MRKFFILTLIFVNTYNFAFAQELVLSDRIREAREAAKKEQIKEKVSNIKPINVEREENICNSEELTEKEQVNLLELHT